jgi:hypothetical protein
MYRIVHGFPMAYWEREKRGDRGSHYLQAREPAADRCRRASVEGEEAHTLQILI